VAEGVPGDGAIVVASLKRALRTFGDSGDAQSASASRQSSNDTGMEERAGEDRSRGSAVRVALSLVPMRATPCTVSDERAPQAAALVPSRAAAKPLGWRSTLRGVACSRSRTQRGRVGKPSHFARHCFARTAPRHRRRSRWRREASLSTRTISTGRASAPGTRVRRKGPSVTAAA
jgi:hypothetical protein